MTKFLFIISMVTDFIVHEVLYMYIIVHEALYMFIIAREVL